MTVPLNYSPNVVTANGATTIFPFGFLVLEAAHLVVEVDGVPLAYPSGYAVTGVGSDAGGNALLTAPPAAGARVVCRRATPFERQTDYQNLGDLLSDTLNADQDAPILMLQELKEAGGRALTLPVGSGATPELPPMDPGRFVRTRLDGSGFDYVEGTGALPGNFTQSGTGAVGRSYDAKLGELYVSPEDFGAKGDFNPEAFIGTDDSAAWNAMLTWLRTQTARDAFGVVLAVPDRDQFTKFVIRCRPGAIYRLDSSLNFTGFRSRGVHVMGNGATLYSYGINNKPVVDGIWSRGLYLHDLLIYAENGTYSGSGVQPSYGLVVGRKNSDDGSEHHCENVRIVGWFNRACYLNLSGELISWTKCALENYVSSTTDFTGLAMHLTDTVEGGFTSDFQTIGVLPAFGMNNNLFTQCNIQSANGPGIRLNGVTRSVRFVGCYCAVTSAFPAVKIRGNHYKMELDISVETSSCTANVEFDVVSNNVNIYGFRIHEHSGQAINLMRCQTGIGTVTIVNGDIEVEGWTGANAATAKLAANSPIVYHGRIKIGATTASLHDFIGFVGIRAEIHTAAAFSAITNIPGAGYIAFYSSQEPYPYFQGVAGTALRMAGAIQVTSVLDQNAAQVLGTRATGWTAATGTANKGAFATGSATLLNCAERIKALEDMLRTHGMMN
ncbi:hypothetical protein [Arenimonas alkanexedens]